MSVRLTTAIQSYEIAMVIAGLVLLWRLGLSPAARRIQSAAALPRWDVTLEGFLRFVLLVIGGTLIAAMVATQITPHINLSGNAVIIFHGAAGQLGMLAGVAGYRLAFERSSAPAPTVGTGKIVMSGVATFLVVLPLLAITGLGWQALLKATGLPTEHQDLIGMFANAGSTGLLTVMIGLAVIVAPVTEELVFRAGFFRYFRTRVSRPLALVVPALLFATLHGNLASFAPLMVLAVVFSLAYERTGTIGTSMVAHALFNLNTIVLILSGVGDMT